ncbi:MAG: energy transducer TonB [Acidobacteria bacterium]|nr:energy transducer TonB [Acidobacteriota bacterium]
MRRLLAAILFTLAAAALSFGQPRVESARRELNAGARLYRAGKAAEAEQHFRRAVELDPDGRATRLYIARVIQQLYAPGVATPENVAVGERAVAAYREMLAKDPLDEEAFKATLLLYAQLEQDDRGRELLLGRANDFSAPNEKRAEAFALLAGRQWQCSYDITEQPANKKTAETPSGATTVYAPPADQGDLIRARQCVTDGMQLVEQAVGLDPKNQSALTYRANLLREASKLAEMEGDAAQKAEYERQFKEALDAAGTKADLGQQAGPAMVAPTSTVPPTEPVSKSVVSGGVLNGKAVSKPAPEYPEIARAARAQGTVTVQILVDEEGNVVSASAVSGHPLLQQAAVGAARQAKFSPTQLSGRPVKVSGVVTYNFVLQ